MHKIMEQEEHTGPIAKIPKLDGLKSEEQTDEGFHFSEYPSMEKIRQIQEEFCRERNWNQYHTPRNILLALVGEVGELAEIFQWKGEVRVGLPDFTAEERKHVGQEMSDILVYLLRLADKCQIDLPAEVMDKIHQNGQKYPVNKVYGKSDKYTKYENKTDECGDNHSNH